MAVQPRAGSLERITMASFVVCALTVACGGAIDPASAGTGTGTTGRDPDDRGATGSNASTGSSASTAPDPGSSSPDASVSTAPADDAGPTTVDCSGLGASCQIFEPGGPERWGCHTIGPEPELTCEHAAGASIARCNCNGRFGESAPGVDSGIAWFDIPATSAMFSEAEMLSLWRTLCGGPCPE